MSFIITFIVFFVMFWFGWSVGKEPKTAKWHQVEGWLGGGVWRCGNCARRVTLMKSNPTSEQLQYCPRCGAKMTLEDDQWNV